ncbi:MAG: hypothetical protein ACOX0C_01695 [Patescibacteria group bacterium]|jgi:hypothetical protein
MIKLRTFEALPEEKRRRPKPKDESDTQLSLIDEWAAIEAEQKRLAVNEDAVKESSEALKESAPVSKEKNKLKVEDDEDEEDPDDPGYDLYRRFDQFR